MNAEIISVGTELTTGQNLDTNSQWLSRQLTALGLTVGFHTTVSDDLSANVEALTSAARRADLVLVTGGLGPTQDDLTREALAAAAGVGLEFQPPLFDIIRDMFEHRGRPMPERNRVQAYLPAGSMAIPNPRGTAPGVWMKLGQAWLAALPGVPGEMKPMFDEFVLPHLHQLGFASGVTVIRTIHAFGAGESAIESKLFDLTKRGRQPEVGITASDTVISLRIVARAPRESDALNLIGPTADVIRERLGDLVFGEGDDELEHVVVRMLIERGHTVATAESCTVGLVARMLGRVPGASDCLRGGVVAYVNDVKQSLLNVPENLLEEHGAVSAPVVEAMATGARKLMKSDFAISTSGIAGPGGATPSKPVGLVYVGLAWDGGVKSAAVNWFGTRDEIQSRSAKSALNMIRLHLIRKDNDPQGTQ